MDKEINKKLVDEDVVEAEIGIEEGNFKGKFVQSTGRRKTSVAQVRIYKNGKGGVAINDTKLKKYFSEDQIAVAQQPVKLTNHTRDIDISIVVRGGGKKGQAEAIRHGISRGLVLLDADLRDVLKDRGLLTRDKRSVERKKPGLKKARKAPQWAKR